MLIAHPQSLPQLVAILELPLSRQKIRAPDERKMRFEIISEALWILNNLTSEDAHSIDEKLLCDHNIHQLLQVLMLYFIEDVGTSSPEYSSFVDHYPSKTTLLDYELRLLEEILWLMCNLSNQEAIAHAFARDRFD